MAGKCPRCGTLIAVRSRRGTRISDHLCPECQIPLQGVTLIRAVLDRNLA